MALSQSDLPIELGLSVPSRSRRGAFLSRFFSHPLRFGLGAKIIVFTALVGIAVTGALTAYMYNGAVDALVDSELQTLSSAGTAANYRFTARINFARQDALFQSQTPSVSGIMRARANGGVDPLSGSTETQWRDRLAALFGAMLAARPEYARIQFVGLEGNGREIVRVERTPDGEIMRTPEESLQEKGNRPHIQAAMQMASGEVFISAIELSQEYGAIEFPHRPVVRTATPAFGDDGDLLGVVVVTVNVAQLFDIIGESLPDAQTFFIANEQGDYLGHPDPALEFGFDLGTRYLIQDDLPMLPDLLAAGGGSYVGIIDLPAGPSLVAASEIYFDPNDPERHIVLAQLRPKSAVAGKIAALRNRTGLVAAGMLALGLLAVAWLARLIVRPVSRVTEAATLVASGERDYDLGEFAGRNDETGELARAFDSLVQEVSAREEDLRARSEELTQSNQELSQFAYVASHDLQEPLRMVASYLGLLATRYRDKLDHEAVEFIGYAVDGAERMKRLINDLLGYSRVSNRPLNKSSVDTKAVIDKIVGTYLAERIGEAGAEVSVGSLPVVNADPLQFERLMINLVDNALKYRSERPPQLRVGAERRDDNWEFFVADNGIGIDPKFRSKVFDIFTRLNDRTTYSGTGIGLASCRRIVERHGGKIWVDAAEGGGSIFRFTLPASSDIEGNQSQ